MQFDLNYQPTDPATDPTTTTPRYTRCTHQFTRGDKRGQQCQDVATAGSDKCCRHKPKKPKSGPAAPAATPEDLERLLGVEPASLSGDEPSNAGAAMDVDLPPLEAPDPNQDGLPPLPAFLALAARLPVGQDPTDEDPFGSEERGTCTHVFARGQFKGQTCTARAMPGCDKCCNHKARRAPAVTVEDVDSLCEAVSAMDPAGRVDGLCAGVTETLGNFHTDDESEEEEDEGNHETWPPLGGEDDEHYPDLDPEDPGYEGMAVANRVTIPNPEDPDGPGISVVVMVNDDQAGGSADHARAAPPAPPPPVAVPMVPEALRTNPPRDHLDQGRYADGDERALLEEIADLLEFIVASRLDRDLTVYTDHREFGHKANLPTRHRAETWGCFDEIRRLHQEHGTRVVLVDSFNRLL